MMRARGVVPILLAFLFLFGCKSTPTPESEIVFTAQDTASFVTDVGEIVFWEVPRFVVWTAPKALFYDFPREGILALRGQEAQVQEVMDLLNDEDLTVEEEISVSEELQLMTGLPIRSTARWRAWWAGNREKPEEEWRSDFVDAAVTALESPDYFARSQAIEDLRLIFGTTLDYDPKASDSDLAEGAARWRSWLEENELPPLPEEPF